MATLSPSQLAAALNAVNGIASKVVKPIEKGLGAALYTGGRVAVPIKATGGTTKTNSTTAKKTGGYWNDYIYNKTGTPWLDQYKKTEAAYQKRLADETAQMDTKQAQAIADSNKTYDANARQNYINYMQAQKALPSQLNALGIRGGASESSALRLGTTYGQNVASNEAARATAQDALRQTYAQQIQDLRNDYNNRMLEARATAEKNQFEWEQNQQQLDLQRFSGTIQGLYKTKDGYLKLIEKLKNSSDPNRRYKIALAQQAMNQLEDEEKSSGSSGGSRRSSGRSYSSSSSSSSGSSESSYTPVRNGTLTNGGTTTYVNRDTPTTAKKKTTTTSRRSTSRQRSYNSKSHSRRAIRANTFYSWLSGRRKG